MSELGVKSGDSAMSALRIAGSMRPYLAYTGGVSDYPACSLHLVGKQRYFSETVDVK
jgi:hypothetical protein